MLNPLRYRFFAPLFMLLAVLSFNGCYKFEGEQTIPAYLQIDTVFFTTDYASQGSKTHQFTDVWVYVNDQLIGAFELPAKFPVLARGKNKLEIRPGIRLNGIAATRAAYPFVRAFIVQDFSLFEDSVVRVNPTTSYYTSLNFAWMEDFERANISMEKSGQSDTSIFATQPAHNPEALLSDNSAYSGIVHLEGEKSKFQIISYLGYKLPGKGSPVFLELDYKCDRAFGVGLLARIDNTILNLPLLVVNKSQKWNKIYINLTPIATEYINASYFKVYFESEKGSDSQARFYFDNIKLIHRSDS